MYRIELHLRGMTLNVGFRTDYWIPGRYVEDAIKDTNSIIITDKAREIFYDETFNFPWFNDPFKMKARAQSTFWNISPCYG